MFFNRTHKTIDITSDSVRFVEIEGSGSMPRLIHAATDDLPDGLVVPSFAKSNISDRELLKEKISALIPDKKRGGDIALCLPDSLVKITSLSFEDLPAKKDEATKLILWRLKKTVPLPTELIKIDYAILSQEEAGVQVLTAAASKTVIREYEDVLRELGFRPRLVDIATLSALFLYKKTIDDNSLFINFKDNIMSFAFLVEGKVEFFRSKEMDSTPATVEKEFASTYRYYQANFREQGVDNICVHLAGENSDEILSALKNSFEGEIAVLRLLDFASCPASLTTDENYSSAIGLALTL